MFGADARSTTNWYAAASYGQVEWTGDVTPVLTIADPNGCNLNTIAARADSAAETAGYTLSDYPDRMIDFPSAGCGSRGYADVAGTYSWVENGLANIANGYEQLLPSHELGHGLGLFHAHGLECGSVTVSADCVSGSAGSIDEYGNAYSVMGNNWPGDVTGGVAMFSPKELIDLGWFAGRSTAVTSSGGYDVAPIELSSSSTTQALVITTATHRYYVEYRRPLGVDAFLTNYPQATNGVFVSMRDDVPGGDGGPVTLDLAPNSDTSCAYCDWYDATLDVGQTYEDPDGSVMIHVDAVTSSKASVTVTTTDSGDTTAPTFTKLPKPRLMTSIKASKVPVRIAWAAKDAAEVCAYEAQESVGGGAFVPLILPTATSVSVVRAETYGTSYAYLVRAMDCNGNWSLWLPSATFTPHKVEEGATRIGYTGPWSTQSITGASGGAVRYASTSGPTATMSFKGRAVGFVSVEGPGRGTASFAIDGSDRGAVDLSAGTLKVRRVVFSTTFARASSHAIGVTSVSPRIDLDAIVWLA